MSGLFGCTIDRIRKSIRSGFFPGAIKKGGQGGRWRIPLGAVTAFRKQYPEWPRIDRRGCLHKVSRFNDGGRCIVGKELECPTPNTSCSGCPRLVHEGPSTYVSGMGNMIPETMV
jgi:hypothetical protein